MEWRYIWMKNILFWNEYYRQICEYYITDVTKIATFKILLLLFIIEFAYFLVYLDFNKSYKDNNESSKFSLYYFLLILFIK